MEKWEIVLKGHKKLKKLLQIEAEKLGLTYTEVQVLHYLTEGEKNVTSLAKLVDVNKSTMVEVLDKLDRMGYIIRERDAEDRRVVRVRITESGEKILEQVRARYRDLINSLLEKVKDNDKVVEFFEVIMEEECKRKPQVNVKGEVE
ncbi:MarR family winged helix-turn-helix transcriptional regulator [Stygiolobus azoricus]|uniref:Winged helix DNA-binding protein n=1 Tax=Stygiolobus azoricus TaxID=41675 RepID=A0A650CLB6_9CREN|nr:MarR family transcriptional regulator [Stygiolobus azoricus]QGR18671.1 winged helix DNA-binding protein [Stygiolobus azoricus]